MKIRFKQTSLIIIGLAALCSCNNEPVAPGQPDESKPVNPEKKDSSSLDTLLTRYDPPDRVVWQKPELVINKMGDLSTKVIADIGAGSGFFSRRLAQQAKKVIAIELDQRFIHFMDSIKKVELKPEYQRRLETRLATPTDSKLQPGEANIILIVNTYIYVQNRVDYLKHLLSVLPSGGQIIIVDFKKKKMPISYPPPKVRLELFEVENELETAGFTNIVSDDCSLDYQYVAMATKE
jgi:SAM-dependent methyltransferase